MSTPASSRWVAKQWRKVWQEAGFRIAALCIASLTARYDIRTVQELLGHNEVRTTMIYAHVLNRGGPLIRSPADRLYGPVLSRTPAAEPRPRPGR